MSCTGRCTDLGPDDSTPLNRKTGNDYTDPEAGYDNDECLNGSLKMNAGSVSNQQTPTQTATTTPRETTCATTCMNRTTSGLTGVAIGAESTARWHIYTTAGSRLPTFLNAIDQYPTVFVNPAGP